MQNYLEIEEVLQNAIYEKYIGRELLTKTFEKLGYTKNDIVNTIKKINAMNKMFS